MLGGPFGTVPPAAKGPFLGPLRHTLLDPFWTPFRPWVVQKVIQSRPILGLFWGIWALFKTPKDPKRGS